MTQSPSIKVLFVTGWYPTEETPTSGIFVNEHARAVSRMGIDVKVAHVWPVKDRDFWYKPVYLHHDCHGIDSYSALFRSRLPGLWYNVWPTLQKVLFEMVEQEITGSWMPDLIHGHALYPAGFLAMNLAEKMEIPYLMTEHWSKLDWVFSRPFYAGTGQKVYRGAESIHPVSDYLGARIREFVPDPAGMEVIPNVVDPELFTMTGSGEEDPFPQTKHILCITRFSDEIKQPELLVEAFQSLDESTREKLHLTFIGPGEGQQELREQCDPDRISFLGGRPKSYIAGQMRKSDYLFHPTKVETFGLVVAEALCSGVPCVVSDVPALPELVNKDNGVLVSENTVGAWAEAFEDVAGGTLEFDRAAIARENSGRFSYEGIGKAYLEAYQKIL